MKKVLSIVLAIIMAITALAPITAFAGENTFSQYVNSSGKKGGEIYGSYESVRLIVNQHNLQGYDEVISLVNQSEAKFTAATEAQKAAYFAHVEVEKDKVEAAGINAEADEELGTGIIEGFGSSIGDPSACGRDCDVIIADCATAKSDAETAIEKYNKAISGNFEEPDTYDQLMSDSRNCASRAFLEYSDAEETYYKIYLMFKDSWDYVLAKNEPILELRERAVKLKEKADSDVRKNHECLDKAKELIAEAKALGVSAYEKAVVLCNNASEEDKPYCEKINYCLWGVCAYVDSHGTPNSLLDDVIGLMNKIEPAVFDVDVSSTLIASDRLSGYDLFELRKTLPSILLSRWYLTANELTYNGKEQKLVTLGTDVYVPEGEQVKFALGSAPTGVLDDVVYSSASLDDDKYRAVIPTAKEPGTYYVYAKFPDGTNIVSKVVIKKAKPAPKPEPVKPTVPEKEANTLKAKGKKVKVNAAKLEKKKVTVKRKKAISVKGAQGTVSYKKTKGNKMISVAKNGKIIIKKGLKAGTYKIRIKVTAKGNEKYKKGSKTVIVKVVIK